LYCRTGRLRVGRPLRGGCSGRGDPGGLGPRVARRMFPLHEMTFSRLPYIVISANDLDWSIDEDYDDET